MRVRLQEYAISIFPQITSRSALKKAIARERILINGVQASTANWIVEGQKIELLDDIIPNRKIFKFNLDVLYEDEHLAVVHKPAGIATNGNYFRTLENALPYNLTKSRSKDVLPYAVPVHRLDTPTAGIILVAKTKSAQQSLYTSFKTKEIQKTYHALVHHRLSTNCKVDLEIDGKKALTLFEPINHYEIGAENFTLVKAVPITGRTHQIRIHLSYLGHPIVGDLLYGLQESYFKHKNLFLFSSGISMKHPCENSVLDFSLKLPKRFRNLKSYRTR